MSQQKGKKKKQYSKNWIYTKLKDPSREYSCIPRVIEFILSCIDAKDWPWEPWKGKVRQDGLHEGEDGRGATG